MSFPLPPAGSPAREMMGDLAHIAEVLAPENVAKLMPIWLARKRAIAMFQDNHTVKGAMKRVAMVTLRADSDERWLVSFGPRGGWRKEWNFGTGAPVPPRYTIEVKINEEHAAAAYAAIAARGA